MQRRLMANSDGASATSTNTASAASASAMKRKKKGWLELRSFRGNFRRLWVVLRNDILVLAKTESVRALLSLVPSVPSASVGVFRCAFAA